MSAERYAKEADSGPSDQVGSGCVVRDLISGVFCAPDSQIPWPLHFSFPFFFFHRCIVSRNSRSSRLPCLNRRFDVLRNFWMSRLASSLPLILVE